MKKNQNQPLAWLWLPKNWKKPSKAEIKFRNFSFQRVVPLTMRNWLRIKKYLKKHLGLTRQLIKRDLSRSRSKCFNVLSSLINLFLIRLKLRLKNQLIDWKRRMFWHFGIMSMSELMFQNEFLRFYVGSSEVIWLHQISNQWWKFYLTHTQASNFFKQLQNFKTVTQTQSSCEFSSHSITTTTAKSSFETSKIQTSSKL